MRDKVNAITLINHRDREIECFICKDLWQWQIDHQIPRNELVGQFTKSFFHIYREKTSSFARQRSNLHHHSGDTCLLAQFPDLSQFTDPEPF